MKKSLILAVLAGAVLSFGPHMAHAQSRCNPHADDPSHPDATVYYFACSSDILAIKYRAWEVINSKDKESARADFFKTYLPLAMKQFDDQSLMAEQFLRLLPTRYPASTYPNVNAAARRAITPHEKIEFYVAGFRRALADDIAAITIDDERLQALRGKDREFVAKLAANKSIGPLLRAAAKEASVGTDAQLLSFFASGWLESAHLDRVTLMITTTRTLLNEEGSPTDLERRANAALSEWERLPVPEREAVKPVVREALEKALKATVAHKNAWTMLEVQANESVLGWRSVLSNAGAAKASANWQELAKNAPGFISRWQEDQAAAHGHVRALDTAQARLEAQLRTLNKQ